MAISPTSATNSHNGPSAMNKMLDRNLDEQFDIFLKMFLAQMKNQDPSSPMDGMQMTNNLLMFFSATEQAKTNFYLKQMNESKTRETNMAARSYLNKEVDFLSDVINFKGEGKDISYQIPANTKINDATLALVNLKGQVVYSRELEGDDIEPGTHKIKWDGKDKEDQIVQNGHYIVKIMAHQAPTAGSKLPSTLDLNPVVQGVGRITEVMYTEAGDPQFIVDDIPISFDDILKVRSVKNPYSQLNQGAHPLAGNIIPVEQNVLEQPIAAALEAVQ
jgi:flagellar basal-body rod modification protein FlgD